MDYYSSFDNDVKIVENYHHINSTNTNEWDPLEDGKSMITVEPFSVISPGDTITITLPTGVTPLAWASSNTMLELNVTSQDYEKGLSLNNFELPKNQNKYWDYKIESYRRGASPPIEPVITVHIPDNSTFKGTTIEGVLKMDIIYADPVQTSRGYTGFVDKEYHLERKIAIPIMSDQDVAKIPLVPSKSPLPPIALAASPILAFVFGFFGVFFLMDEDKK
jgi:hypothetical protein